MASIDVEKVLAELTLDEKISLLAGKPPGKLWRMELELTMSR